MKVDPDTLDLMEQAYWDASGGTREGIEAAIDAYFSSIDSIKPGAIHAFEPPPEIRLTTGDLVPGEPIQPIRDYRKELWIAHWLACDGTVEQTAISCAAAVNEFDKFFAEQKEGSK